MLKAKIKGIHIKKEIVSTVESETMMFDKMIRDYFFHDFAII